jgi:hypothetical protein
MIERSPDSATSVPASSSPGLYQESNGVLVGHDREVADRAGHEPARGQGAFRFRVA